MLSCGNCWEVNSVAEKTNVPEIRFAGFTDPWEQRKFSELASLRRGLTYSPVDIRPYGQGIRVLRSSNIDEDEFTLSNEDVFVDETVVGIELVQEGEILITAANGSPRLVGKRAIIDGLTGKTVHGGFMLCAHAEQPDYVAALMGSRWYQHFLATGVTGGNGSIGNLDKAALEDEYAFVPSIKEQELIGALFSRLSDLITLHQRKHDKLCAVKKSMLDKMFPKPSETEPEIRFAGFTDPWEQRKLGNCGTTYSGLSGKTKEDFGHGSARFVPYTNVFDNPLTDTKRLEAVEIDSSQNKIAYGDVFFTVSSETPDEVGMSSVWLSDQEDVYLNSFCFGYRQDSTFDSHYLAYMLRSSSIRSNLALLAQGISRFNISKNKVMELSVPVPSAVEQKQIGQYFALLDNLITLHQRKLNLLKNTKKSLLDRMFV